MTQVVFLLRADGAVGQEHEHVLAGEAADGVVGIDPRVHAFSRLELRPRRTELDGDNA